MNLIKIEINWHRRRATVTSLTGGHTAHVLNIGNEMEIIISDKEKDYLVADSLSMDTGHGPDRKK